MPDHLINRIAVLLLFSLVFFSCKKEKDPTNKQKIVGKWQLTGLTETPAQADVDGDGVKDSDYYQFLDDCEKQFIFEFQADGTYIEDYSSCDPGSGNESRSTWSMNTEETELTFSGQVFDIDQISSTTMSISVSTDLNGETVKQTGVYTKK